MAIYVRFASGTDDTSSYFAEDSIAQSLKSNKRLRWILEWDIVGAWEKAGAWRSNGGKSSGVDGR